MILINAAKHFWKHGKAASTATQWKPEYGTLFDLPAKDLFGDDFDMKQLKGKVTLIVNVACDCGYTKSGYQAMVAIRDRIVKERGEGAFEVLAFPSNQFGAQESRPEQEIKEFVTSKFGVNFPLLQKADVNGLHEQPVYAFLKKCFPGDITWNFAAKFIVNHEGVPIARMEKESWDEVEKKIKHALEDRDAAAAAHAAAPAAAAAEGEAAAKAE